MADRIESLTPPERLRLAAALLEEREAPLAYAIAHKVVDELGLAIGLGNTPIPPTRGLPPDDFGIDTKVPVL